MTGARRDFPTVAVVIPTLNEQTALAATLQAVLEQLSEGVRLFAADGGSSDGTIALAEQSGVRVVQCSKPGRGHQIAEVVRGLEEDIVLILHADMILPPGAIQLMRHWLANHPACPGGSFGHRFDSARRVYRLVEAWDSARARFGISYGDQAQFYRRELLERGGGFPDLALMEDVELSRRLRANGRPAYLDFPVVVSPRRFERLGWWRTVLINLSLRAAHRFGGQPMSSRLCHWYYKQVD